MAEDLLCASLTLAKGPAGQVGTRRIALLEAVREHGSIQAAAKAVGLSYKGAWDAAQALNNLFERPLIMAQAGGTKGGAAQVTADGEAVIAAFREVQDQAARAIDQLQARLKGTAGPSLASHFWSLAMKTSARNALGGVVTHITDGAVNAEVTLDIGEGRTIVAVLTRASVESLGLTPGRRALALIKSSFVTLAPGKTALRTSARNCLAGTIVRREDGAVNSEVVLDLGAGKTLTAVVTLASAEALGLAIGEPAQAFIKASHIILAVE